MLELKPVTLTDKSLLLPVLRQNPYLSCSLSFQNMIIWSDAFSPHYVFVDEMLVLVSMEKEGVLSYNFPIGSGNVKKVIDILIKNSEENNSPFRMVNITDEMKLELEVLYPETFLFEERRDSFDYVYNRDDLMFLKGKHYQSKRNHINKFKSLYDYQYHAMREQDIDDCAAMHEQWVIENDCGPESCFFELENCAVRKALKLFKELEWVGGVLRVDGKVVAFTLGNPLNDIVFDVNIEKALTDYHGSYTMINQQFVEHQLSGFKYVNREEDVGDEGLRRAKMSYHPEILLRKYVVTRKEE